MKSTPLNIVVIGASGDLSRNKIIPVLFTLFCRKMLPGNFQIIGFARSALDDDSFRAMLAETLTCRHTPRHNCAEITREFLGHCFYCRGEYADRNAFLDAYRVMRNIETDGPGNRLFYMAVPPLLFKDVARALGDAGLVHCAGPRWSRVIIEKPFGMDRADSDRLVAAMHDVFTEPQTWRIDHYLGKEVIQNLMVLRFANTVFEPVWNREHVAKVEIIWHEDIGVGDRGGYFDGYGIMRDVMQNHLLQIMALTAMERPVALDHAPSVRAAKVRLLRAVVPLRKEDLVLGQYRGAMVDGQRRPGYREERHVPPDSVTPTFSAACLTVKNRRWAGVPFLMRAGKALNDRMTEIRIHFRPPEQRIFRSSDFDVPANQLVIRVQPDEAIYLRINNKVPGLTMELKPTVLDLRYATAFRRRSIPSAYEALLLDALEGDRSLFISEPELAAAWDVFTPVLHALEQEPVEPELYDFNSAGPDVSALNPNNCQKKQENRMVVAEV